ncbi:hypothetical protein [Methylorubrum extorquens]|uniref:hypothetical protein n=1 Tax=Methylorubrum extorquens TaxID=408 RepID=UPI00209CA64E|nr:hypothetical protein [Methylorubrum extorquens]MCP1540181.1 hypothetical protein [Methylorubrum extorquens]
MSSTLENPSPASNLPCPLGPVEIVPTREMARYRADAAARGEHVQEWPMPGTGGRLTCARCFRTAEDLDEAKSYRYLGLPLPSDP